MRTLFTRILFVVALIISSQLFAQQRTNIEALNTLSEELTAEWENAQVRVLEYARDNNIEIWQETTDGRARELVDVVDGKPIYYVTDNLGAGHTTRVNELWVGGNSGLDYTGEGYFQLGEWDAGHVRKTHQEFMNTGTTRIFHQDGNYATHFHATHVAGTMIAAGVVGDAKGALYGGKLKCWEWSNDNSEMAAAAANGLEISNHSYGFLRGWYHDNGTWVWYGNSSIDNNEDYLFGFYDGNARLMDLIAWNAPNYLIVRSAGNDRGEGPSNGEHENDGGADGYDCIGSEEIAKNILTVGAVYQVMEYTGPESVNMSNFSCWGPADDGRIKPDIVGKGVSVYSTMDGSNTSYTDLNGTSMSAPNVSGSMAMLQYHYQETHNGTPMRAATLKGLVLHTASEAGDYPGPDYKFGWGLMNAEFAAQIISDDVGQDVMEELQLTSGNDFSRDVYVPAGNDFTITICWTDVAGVPTSAQLNPSTPMIVNDLDLRITDANSDTYYPWRLNRDVPAAAATNITKNYVDNVEKVEIQNAEGGTYTIHVDYEGTLSGGSQYYSLIISGIEDYDVIPECSTALSSPEDGGTDANINHNVTWEPALFASSYDIYFGTDGGGTTTPTNIFNGDNILVNNFSTLLQRNTTYYVQITPKNNVGVASDCNDIWSFTTMGAIDVYPYEEGMETTTKPDLPEFWQAYNYSLNKWESTNILANSGSMSMGCFYDNGLVEYEYDNWFVSPPFEVTDGNEYNASFYYKGFIPGHSESMSVYWGYTPFVADMTNLIFENNDITEANFTEGEGLIIPNTDTIIFLGFHLNSPTGYGGFLDDIKMENWGAVGVGDSPEILDPKVYSSGVNIIIKTDESWENANVDVVSLLGQKIISTKHYQSSKLDMNAYGSGVYLVRIYKDNNSFTRKIIIR